MSAKGQTDRRCHCLSCSLKPKKDSHLETRNLSSYSSCILTIESGPAQFSHSLFSRKLKYLSVIGIAISKKIFENESYHSKDQSVLNIKPESQSKSTMWNCNDSLWTVSLMSIFRRIFHSVFELRERLVCLSVDNF